MSATTRTIKAAPSMGQLALVFAALLAGTALIVALAYGQLTMSQLSVAPAAAPAPVAHDHGWSSSSVSTAPVTHDHGWSSTSRGPISVARDSGWFDTTPIRPVPRDSGWIDTTPVRTTGRSDFDKSHHGITLGERFERNGGGSNKARFAE